MTVAMRSGILMGSDAGADPSRWIDPLRVPKVVHPRKAAVERSRPMVAAPAALIFGVRPISPQHTKRILSLKPRDSMSSIKAALHDQMGTDVTIPSRIGALLMSACISHTKLVVTVTNPTLARIACVPTREVCLSKLHGRRSEDGCSISYRSYRSEQLLGVISLDKLGVFLRQIKSLGYATYQSLKGLLLQCRGSGDTWRSIRKPLQSIQLRKKALAIFQTRLRYIQSQVLLQMCSCTWNKR